MLLPIALGVVLAHRGRRRHRLARRFVAARRRAASGRVATTTPTDHYRRRAATTAERPERRARRTSDRGNDRRPARPADRRPQHHDAEHGHPDDREPVTTNERLRARFEAEHPFPLDDFQRHGARRPRCRPLGARRRARPGPARRWSPSTRSRPRSSRAARPSTRRPLKALSNQKYGDFVRIYGAENVGLLTGDNAINGDAPVVVMTTEVLRNMIYAGSAALEGLRYAVLDEVHYLQDRDPGRGVGRGDHPPPGDIAIVALSATVSNAEEVAAWMQTVRGETEAIIEERRPVELVAPLPGRRTRRRRAASPARRSSKTTASSGPTRWSSRLDGRGPARGEPGRAGRGSTNRGAPRWSSGWPTSRCFPRSCSCSPAPAATRRSSSASTGGVRLTNSADRVALRRIADAHLESARRRRPRRAGLRLVDRGPRSGRGRAPRGDGPADEGSGRGGVHRGPAEGRVRDRDALVGHQHARPLRGGREALEVHRRAPRAAHAGRVHPARGTRRPPRHRRRRVRGGAVGSVRRLRPGRRSRRRGARTRSPRRSARPTTWPPTWCSGTTREKRGGCSTCRSRSITPTATPSRSTRQLEKTREQLARARDAAEIPERRHRGVPGAARGLRRSAARRMHAVQDSRLDKLRPGDVVMAPATRRPGGGVEAGARAIREPGARVDPATHDGAAHDRRLPGPDSPGGDDRAPAAVRAPEPALPTRPRPTLLRRLPDRVETSAEDADARVEDVETRMRAHPLHGAAGTEVALRGAWQADRIATRRRPARTPDRGQDRDAGRGSSIGCSRCWSRGATYDGWELLPSGELLARLNTEGDLVVAESLRTGLLDGLDAAELTTVVSCFVYQRRGPDADEPMPPRRWPDPLVRKQRVREIEKHLDVTST